MENAVDALKMAFAMLVFVMALSVAIYALSEARETSDYMIAKADPMEFVEIPVGDEIATNKVRTVGLETIIPTLYKYYKEDYMVVFQDRRGEPYVIYNSQTNPTLWANSYKKIYGDGNNYNSAEDLRFNETDGVGIACFDVEEETARREPWTASADIDFKKNLDAILFGKRYDYPDGSGRVYDYRNSAQVGDGGLIYKLREKEFDEYIGERDFSVYNAYAHMDTKKTKRVIIYREK